MDAAALASLLSDSTQKLVDLHSQIGHPPEALHGALDALHQALKTAVDDQIGKVQREAQNLSSQCFQIQADNAQIKTALGEKPFTSNPSLQNAVGKRMVSAASPPTPTSECYALESQPLLQRRSQLQTEQTRLKASYTAKEAQLDRLSTKLHTYLPLLGSFVNIPEDSSQESATIDNSSVATFRDVSQPRIALFEAEIIRCSKEINARSERLQTTLLEIVQLWSELNIEPAQPAALVDDRVFESEPVGDEIDCGGGTLSFDRAILAHLQLEPIHDDETRQFVGEFVTTEQPERRDAASCRGTQAIDDILSDTPTKASLGGLPARNSGELALQLSSATKTASAPACPAHLLEPSELNLARAAKKISWLEAEKQRREMLIQELYDELSELWAKFDVPEEEMDAFVMDHRGSTKQVIQAYQAELEKMKQLKAQHMSLFITKTRERIATLWDSLFLTDEEREAAFPSFFIDVSGDAGPNMDEPLPTDEILASHEQMIDLLTEQVRVKAPVLKVIGRYKELLDEARQLDESASDGSRLLGRSNRGDPGRLLREEKMRKRVKIQKPKIEAELLKVIPAWEEEHGEPFTINGVRYLDELMDQVEGSKENANRKRTRTMSGTSAVPPASAPASVRRGPLVPSASSNRNVSATPMRSLATPAQGTIKKPRIAAAPATVAAPSSRTPSVRQGAVSASVSRVASTARVPVSAASKVAQYGAASVSRPASSMGGNYRTASSASYAAGGGSPSRIPGPSPHLAPKPFGGATAGYASAHGYRNTTTSTAGLGAARVKAQRESFRPRPSLVAKVACNSTVVGGRVGTDLCRAGTSAISPGRASKWGEMGPPRWPAAGQQPTHSHRDVSCISATSSIHTDITTVVHPATKPVGEPRAKITRRAPSMSLEACLANLAATSAQGKARLGDKGRDLGICSIRNVSSSDNIVNQADGDGGSERVMGWKDGLRIAGADLEEGFEVEEGAEEEMVGLPRSGSSNWEIVGEAEPESHFQHAALAA
ncbi:related to ASE1 - mitotic spindle midzone localized MAP family member [Melanopsichium pennsylvanicum]|uniref:Related to ASE1 - mitotic spindle midzone localized MAP family member n=2 Tax=Melanopsichium pennsylvanicum TaxID=63383 RepID=A0AAJ5C441_9BASI|nr:microtubule associated protein [Melanopsichium pennsylvanicum 4]SNX83173.1 related to ASE1 - mitotic spindle midzone localized MAP family member [Melanopsichium pennsylvanicum]